MKTKNIILALLLMCTSGILFAQDETAPPQTVDPRAREKVEAARIGLISNRLGLTTEQAERFWPIYREFSRKQGEVRQEFQQAQRSVDPKNSDPKQQEALINLGLKLRQQEVDLEKDYSGRILQVITAQQLISLRKAEQDFRQLILNQLQQRRAQQQRKETFRENQQLRRNRN